jgi:hypothetical protein
MRRAKRKRSPRCASDPVLVSMKAAALGSRTDARATHTCSTVGRLLDSRRASAGRSDRRIRADLSHQPGGEIAGALVAHKPATGRREEAHTNMWPLREARDVGRSSHRTAQYASLGHSLGQTAEAASGPQISAAAASALREDAETRARAQLRDGALKRRRVRRSPFDRDLPHSVEDVVQPLDPPHRRLRERTDLPPRQRSDPDRHRIPVAVVIDGQEHRPVIR